MALRPVQPEAPLSPRSVAAFSQVLYVEDEDSNWNIAELQLRDTFALTRARDAREAFDRLGKRSFDLILMDIQLCGSELDGVQLARILKGTYTKPAPPYAVPPPDGERIPIVFVTAYGSRYTKGSLSLVGGADVIYKPVNFTALKSCIERLALRDGRRTPRQPPDEA